MKKKNFKSYETSTCPSSNIFTINNQNISKIIFIIIKNTPMFNKDSTIAPCVACRTEHIRDAYTQPKSKKSKEDLKYKKYLIYIYRYIKFSQNKVRENLF